MSDVELYFNEEGLLLPQTEPYYLNIEQIEAVFGYQNHDRRNIFECFSRGVTNLFESGVKRVILGGSFISKKEIPGDADIAWWYSEQIDWKILDPVFQVKERGPARGKYCLDQKIDGIQELDYEYSHEYFLRYNTRMPEAYQSVGIIKICFGDDES